MGKSYSLRCKNCGYLLKVRMGVGFSYPSICAEELGKVRAGEYGAQLQQLAMTTPDIAVCCEERLLLCDTCGTMRNGAVLELCVPTEENTDWRHIYASEIDFWLGAYRCIASRREICERCGSEMRAVREKELLFCPQCKSPLKVKKIGNYD